MHAVEKKHCFPNVNAQYLKVKLVISVPLYVPNGCAKFPNTVMALSSLSPFTVPLLRQIDCPSLNSRHWLSQRLTSRLFKNVQCLRMSQKHSQNFYMHTSMMVIERNLHARLHSLCLRHTLKACMHYTHPISHCPNSSSLSMLSSSGFPNMKDTLWTCQMAERKSAPKTFCLAEQTIWHFL